MCLFAHIEEVEVTMEQKLITIPMDRGRASRWLKFLWFAVKRFLVRIYHETNLQHSKEHVESFVSKGGYRCRMGQVNFYFFFVDSGPTRRSLPPMSWQNMNITFTARLQFP